MRKTYPEPEEDTVKEPSLSDRIDQSFVRLATISGQISRIDDETRDSLTELETEIRRIKEFIGLK